jgi:hypothetical protein
VIVTFQPIRDVEQIEPGGHVDDAASATVAVPLPTARSPKSRPSDAGGPTPRTRTTAELLLTGSPQCRVLDNATCITTPTLVAKEQGAVSRMTLIPGLTRTPHAAGVVRVMEVVVSAVRVVEVVDSSVRWTGLLAPHDASTKTQEIRTQTRGVIRRYEIRRSFEAEHTSVEKARIHPL